MNYLRWLWSVVRRDGDRERRNMELTRLTLRSEQVVDRSDRVRAEQERLIQVLRKTVAVMRSESHRK